MEISEKIRQIRRQQKISRQLLHLKLKNIYGEHAINSNTIWRIENGITAARLSSLHQLCAGLGVSLGEIMSQIQPKSKVVDLVHKNKRMEYFAYNKQARADILTNPELDFFIQELILLPQGKTNIEEDPLELGKFHKWVYCLAGALVCQVGTERYFLRKGDYLCFQSHIAHSFLNESSRKCRALIVQYPKHV